LAAAPFDGLFGLTVYGSLDRAEIGIPGLICGRLTKIDGRGVAPAEVLIAAKLGVSQPTASGHVKILRTAEGQAHQTMDILQARRSQD